MLTPFELDLFNRRDREVILQVYKKHLHKVCLFANHFLDSWEESEDVAASTFLKICSSKEAFENEKSIERYWCEAVKNECIDRIRKRKVHRYFERNVKKK